MDFEMGAIILCIDIKFVQGLFKVVPCPENSGWGRHYVWIREVNPPFRNTYWIQRDQQSQYALCSPLEQVIYAV